MATTSGTKSSSARIARLALLGGTTAGLVGLAAWALVAMRVNTRCSYAAIEGLRSFALVSFSIGGFVGGHLLGQWIEASNPTRDSNRQSVISGTGVREPARSRGHVAVQGAAVAFLALSTILLAYETLSLADVGRNWPITYYVRCFASSDPWWPPALGALGVCFLLGHWLWYPAGDRNG